MTYAYNAQGQRVTRVEDEVVTHFYYTGSALLFTTVNEYVLQTQNILDPSGTIVASKRFEGQAETGQDPYAEDYFFYRYDIRGSVTTIVDGEGAVVKSYDYDEFGVTTSTGDAFFNEVTFTGSIADASGLLYMNARYYNPSTARFLSQDSYTGSAFDPWTQHLYAYCNNNPVNMIDPTGHVPVRATAVYVNLGGGDSSTKEEVVPVPQYIDNQYINDQEEESIADLPFGEEGTIAKNGCGMVALYNVLVASGWKHISFEALNERFSDCDGLHLFGGKLGMNPFSMSGALSGVFGDNVAYNALGSRGNYDAIIVLYVWYSPDAGIGAHYFTAVEHTPGKYISYNNHDDSLHSLAQLRTYVMDKNWIIESWGITFQQEEAKP